MSTRALNPAYVAGVQAMLKATPYFDLLGMEMEELDDGRAVFRIPAQSKHLNPFQRVHGGVAASILDAATFWAVYSNVEPGKAMTTAELNINYLGPAGAGKTLRATGQLVKVGNTLGLGTARLMEVETDRLVAFGKATCMIIEAPPAGPLSKLPPKFM